LKTKYYDEKKPFIIWFETKDVSVKTKIITKINFLRNGNFSNCKPVEDRLFERKLLGIWRKQRQGQNMT